MAQPITALNPTSWDLWQPFLCNCSQCNILKNNATGINNSSINQWIFINGFNTQIHSKLLELSSYHTVSTRFWTRTFLPCSLLIGVSPITVAKWEPMGQLHTNGCHESQDVGVQCCDWLSYQFHPINKAEQN